jgi:hypothetical protein
MRARVKEVSAVPEAAHWGVHATPSARTSPFMRRKEFFAVPQMTTWLNFLSESRQFHRWLSHSGPIHPPRSEKPPENCRVAARNRLGLISMLASLQGIDAQSIPPVLLLGEREIMQSSRPACHRPEPTIRPGPPPHSIQDGSRLRHCLTPMRRPERKSRFRAVAKERTHAATCAN